MIALRESTLKIHGEEFKLLSKWSTNSFELGPTDRNEFAKLQEKLQKEKLEEGGANQALNTLANLLKDHMVFSGDGKLAADILL